jgi:hypothetical protein
MWILIVAAFFMASPTPEPKAALVAVYTTAKECVEAKAELVEVLRKDASAGVTSFGVQCVQVKTDQTPNKAKPPQA